ncbi:MAG: hypothetical protein ACKVX7_09005 [Planctomycetota bacterium]
MSLARWCGVGAVLVAGFVTFCIAAGHRFCEFGAPPAAFAQDKKDGGDALESHMEAIQSAERKLKGMIDKADKVQDSLGNICEMQRHSFEAKLLQPSHADELEGKDREKFLKAFRLKLVDLERELRTTEQALLNGDVAAAAASFKKVQEIEKAGHSQFRKKS